MGSVLRSAAVVLTAAVVLFAEPAPAAHSLQANPARAALKSLDRVDDLRASFNKDGGQVRLVLLLSPTWPACVNGARWVQQHILEMHPGAPLKVYAVWYAMYGADARDHWRADLLTDRRVEHGWDERRVVGRRLLDELRPHQSLRAPGSKELRGPVLWDAYLLFDRRAQWGTTMPTPVSWGYTILAARDALARQVGEQLRRPNW